MAERKNMTKYKQIADFMIQHPNYYTEYEQEWIKKYAQKNAQENYYIEVLREIYDELDMIPEGKNIYVAFMKLIDEIFGIEGKNIIEVGGGILPRLGKRIHLQQKTGSITVYDPRLGSDIESKERFVIKREEFKKTTPVENADLIIGLMPCKGAEPLIEQATKNNKDFILWFCEGGPHGDYFDYFEDEEEWLGSTIYQAKDGIEKRGMGKLIVKKLNAFSKYPIIYNQREK